MAAQHTSHTAQHTPPHTAQHTPPHTAQHTLTFILGPVRVAEDALTLLAVLAVLANVPRTGLELVRALSVALPVGVVAFVRVLVGQDRLPKPVTLLLLVPLALVRLHRDTCH